MPGVCEQRLLRRLKLGGELLHNRLLGSRIERERIDQRKAGAAAQGVRGFAPISGSYGLAKRRVVWQAFGSELGKEFTRNLAGHRGERSGGGLVLVIVAGAAVHLTDLAWIDAPKDFADLANFQAPAMALRQSGRQAR